MNQKEQIKQLQRLLDTLAMEAMEQPTHTRRAFIESETEKVRNRFRQIHAGDPDQLGHMMELADKMDGWVMALVQILERDGGQIGKA